MMKMNLYEIMVPAVDPAIHQSWDEAVRKIAGGITIYRSVRGQWNNDNGEVVKERMVPVRVACNELQMHYIAELAKAYYQQETVMYWLVSTEVHIV